MKNNWPPLFYAFKWFQEKGLIEIIVFFGSVNCICCMHHAFEPYLTLTKLCLVL